MLIKNMLMEELLKDRINYPHVVSALQHPHKIIKNSEDSLLIFCPVSKVFIAEYAGPNAPDFARFIKNQDIIRLQTTNSTLYDLLKPDFSVHYQCVQAVYDTKTTEKGIFPQFKPLLPEDMPFAEETYGLKTYIQQLFHRNRLFGWYENDVLTGYVAFHIDESTGALYIKPEFRKKGYGAKLMKAAFENYDEGIKYSQIVHDNTGSIKLHEKIGCTISEKPLFWVYNEDFIYYE